MHYPNKTLKGAEQEWCTRLYALYEVPRWNRPEEGSCFRYWAGFDRTACSNYWRTACLRCQNTRCRDKVQISHDSIECSSHKFCRTNNINKRLHLAIVKYKSKGEHSGVFCLRTGDALAAASTYVVEVLLRSPTPISS